MLNLNSTVNILCMDTFRTGYNCKQMQHKPTKYILRLIIHYFLRYYRNNQRERIVWCHKFPLANALRNTVCQARETKDAKDRTAIGASERRSHLTFLSGGQQTRRRFSKRLKTARAMRVMLVSSVRIFGSASKL